MNTLSWFLAGAAAGAVGGSLVTIYALYFANDPSREAWIEMRECGRRRMRPLGYRSGLPMSQEPWFLRTVRDSAGV